MFGQVTNEFACRSTVRLAWQIPLRSNRLLIGAVLAELAMLAGFLIHPAPRAPARSVAPSPAGVLAAILAVPAVLAADTVHKRIARSAKQTRRTQPKTTSAINTLSAGYYGW